MVQDTEFQKTSEPMDEKVRRIIKEVAEKTFAGCIVMLGCALHFWTSRMAKEGAFDSEEGAGRRSARGGGSSVGDLRPRRRTWTPH